MSRSAARAKRDAAIGWFCSKCTTKNTNDDERCCNRKCALSRKVVGVDILKEDEEAEARILGRDASSVCVAIGEKRRRCGDCDGCNAAECGVCIMCRDMCVRWPPKACPRGVHSVR